MKKSIKRLACISATLALCLGAVGCQRPSEQLNPLPYKVKATLKETYLAQLNAQDEEFDSVEVLAYLGEYNGYSVAFTAWQSDTIMIACDIVDYTVDGVLLCMMGRNNDVLAYNAEENTLKGLKDAYAEGEITKQNLHEIQKRFSYRTIEKAYETYLEEKGMVGHVWRYIGKFSGHDVVKTSAGKPDEGVSAVCVDYYVDGVYICQLNDPSYDLTVYTKEGEIKSLEQAYEDGDVSKADLWLIKSAFIVF